MNTFLHFQHYMIYCGRANEQITVPAFPMNQQVNPEDPCLLYCNLQLMPLPPVAFHLLCL